MGYPPDCLPAGYCRLRIISIQHSLTGTAPAGPNCSPLITHANIQGLCSTQSIRYEHGWDGRDQWLARPLRRNSRLDRPLVGVKERDSIAIIRRALVRQQHGQLRAQYLTLKNRSKGALRTTYIWTRLYISGTSSIRYLPCLLSLLFGLPMTNHPPHTPTFAY